MRKNNEQKVFIDFLNLYYDKEGKNQRNVEEIISLSTKKDKVKKRDLSKLIKFQYIFASFILVFIAVMFSTIDIKQYVEENSYNDFIINECFNSNHFNNYSVVDKIIRHDEKYSFYEAEYLDKANDYYVCIDHLLYDQLKLLINEPSNLSIVNKIIYPFEKSFDIFDGKLLYLLNYFKDDLGINCLSDVIKTYSSNNGSINYNEMICIYSFVVIDYKVKRNLETGERLSINKQVVLNNVLHVDNKNKIMDNSNFLSELNYTSIVEYYKLCSSLKIKQLMVYSDDTLELNTHYVNVKGNNDNFCLAAFDIKDCDGSKYLVTRSLYSINSHMYKYYLFNYKNSIFGLQKTNFSDMVIDERKCKGFYEVYFDLNYFLKICDRELV